MEYTILIQQLDRRYETEVFTLSCNYRLVLVLGLPSRKRSLESTRKDPSGSSAKDREAKLGGGPTAEA